MPESAELTDKDLGEVVSAPPESPTETHPSFITDLRRIVNPDYRDPKEIRSSLRVDLRHIYDRYGIQVAMHRRSLAEEAEIVSLDKLELCEAEGGVQLIREELAKYPPEYIKNLGISRFRLVKDLAIVGIANVAGVAYEEGKFYTPSGENHETYKGGQLYATLGESDELNRAVINHELWHFGDFTHSDLRKHIPLVGGGIDAFRDRILDDQWDRLNTHRGEKDLGPIYEPRGYARQYGQMNPREDRATIAEALMTNPAKILRRGVDDPILRKKTERIMQMFHYRSNGKMNHSFFQDLADGKVADGYWP